MIGCFLKKNYNKYADLLQKIKHDWLLEDLLDIYYKCSHDTNGETGLVVVQIKIIPNILDALQMIKHSWLLTDEDLS